MREEHWFSFKNSCVLVVERAPDSSQPSSNPIPSFYFLHGRFAHSGIWEGVIDELSNRFRCFSVNFPGYGRSFLAGDRPFTLFEQSSLVSELVENFTFKDEKVILVGHDSGGGIAQLSLLKSPHKIAALILMNSSLLSNQISSVPVQFKGYLARLKFWHLLQDAKNLSLSSQQLLMDLWEGRESRKVLVHSLQILADSWPWQAERQFFRKELEKQPHPILLLWGKNDSLNPIEEGIEFSRNLREAYLFIHNEIGHWPSLEDPAWVLAKVKEFVFKIGYGALVEPLKTGS